MSLFSNPKSYLLILISLSFLLPFSASAGVIRKPPNNLGLVLYYPMDEGSGTMVGDASGNGRTGTLSATNQPTWSNGKLGKSLYFNGLTTGNQVTFSGINVTNTHTISMWIKISANCASYRNLFASNGGNGLYCLVDGGGNRITYYYGGLDHFSNTNISLNQWHHIAVVNNGGSVTFYLDGAAGGTASGAIAYTATNTGNDLFAESFNGYIDDLRVYSRVFSAAEVLALYKSGSAKIGLSNPSQGTLADGLTGHWTFDGKDMVSNVADVSGNGRNGSLIGQTATTTTRGKIGQALKFDGTNDYVNTNATSGNFITATEGTISVWLRPTNSALTIPSMSSVQNARTAVSTSGLQEFGIFQAYINSDAADNIWIYNNIGSYRGVPYDLNEWIHITWVHSGGVLYAYKNGELIDSVSSGNTTLTANLWIGNNWGFGAATRFWNGDIDDVRTWSRALTASEIKQVYNIGAGQKVSTTKTPVGTLADGLKGHWTFDGADTDWNTNTVTDKSGNGNTGTLTNMSTSTSPVAGKIGQGLNFVAASTQRVALGTSSTIQPGTGSFSVSFWYKGLRGTTESFVSSGPTIGSYWDIQNGGALFVTSSYSVSTSYTLPTDNEWHHLVVVFNRTPSPDTVEAYIDGGSQGAEESTLDNEGVAGGGGVNIGRGPWTGGGFRQGPMDDVRIYNRVLSTSEVQQLYQLGR